MDRRLATLAGAALILALAPAATAQDAPGAATAAVTLPPADAAALPDSIQPAAGSRIAYVQDASADTATIHVIGADGSGDVDIVSGTTPSWAPDGARLAYGCHARGQDVTTSSVCLVDLATSADERVVQRGWGPSWAPEGDSIAFSQSRIDMGDAWVADLASGATTALPGAEPDWSPTGEWVLVTTGSGVPYVTVVRPDGTDEQLLGAGWQGTWSPDGTEIASAWFDGQATSVTAMDVGSAETRPLFAVDGSIVTMRWLPGDTIAFVAGGDDPISGDLYAIDLESGTVRSLTSGLAVGPDLTGSPDGEWLAFSATATNGRTDVYLASRAGGWRQLTTSGDASLPAWAP